ncbi:MAG: iron ABC transporter permease [Mobilitalea sp.]
MGRTELIAKNNEYKRRIRIHNTIIVIACAVILIFSFFISVNTGYTKLTPLNTLRTLLGEGTAKENLVLFDFRMPRILISMLIGAGLSLSGCIIQGVAKNALADPGLLGINAGAGLMVIIYILFFSTNSFLSIFGLPFLALLGAGVTAFFIYILAYVKGEGIAPIRLILTGIALQAGISALTTVLVVKLDDTQYYFVANWQAGGIWGSSWKFVMVLLPWLLILIPYVLSKAKILDVLNLGDALAYGLGADVEKERRRLLIAAVALAAACVATSGNISFVGLIGPHLARRLVGPRHSILLPVSLLTGAVLVTIADTAARVIVQPSGIPTGIMVAIIGAPYFLYLLIKSK